jgi:hypothetical protein
MNTTDIQDWHSIMQKFDFNVGKLTLLIKYVVVYLKFILLWGRVC